MSMKIILAPVLLLLCSNCIFPGKANDIKVDSLRYLAFGTSVTWGFTLPIDPISNVRHSYIYLLSSTTEKVKNLAIRASDAR